VRSPFILTWFAVLAAGACGGNTSTSSSSRSGVPGGKPLSALSSAEVSEICDFIQRTLGGEGARYECSGVTFSIESNPGCIESASRCDALVSEVEACTSAVATALRKCNLDRALPECNTLEACPSSTGMFGGGSDCIDGQAQTCTCGDGRAGAQICVDGELGECECGLAGPIPDCVPGASRVCACQDGSQGAQTCVGSASDATFSVCQCIPTGPNPQCVPGSSAVCRCADGSPGAQTCDGPADSATFGPCVCIQEGPCDPTFCPMPDIGMPCCVTTDGPCGTDSGFGCTAGL
jgi:hypothetical protein